MKLGYFPECLKIVELTPVLKDGDKTEPSNYRLVSILPANENFFEKILYSRIVFFVNKANVITKN